MAPTRCRHHRAAQPARGEPTDPAGLRPRIGAACPGRSELSLLGGFRLVFDDIPIATGPTVQRMLVALVCLGRQAPRNKLAHTLWPDATGQRAQSNLRTTCTGCTVRHPG